MAEGGRVKYTCTHDVDLNIIAVTTHGSATLAALIDMLRTVADLCARHPSANIVVDHSQLDVGPLTMDEIKALSSMTVSAQGLLQTRKCAHVANTDLQFGLVRAWEIMVEIEGLTSLRTRVFKNRDDALLWLRTSP
jgi:hypothetical protein